MTGSGDLKRLAKGLSEVAFRERYGSEEQCREALFAMRWARGWRCEGCGHERHAVLKQRAVLQCNRCKRQVSLTAGTIFHSTKLPLTTWFLAIYHLAQSKGGISSIELGRRLGVRQATAWLMKHKLMQAMAGRRSDQAQVRRARRDGRCLSRWPAVGRKAWPRRCWENAFRGCGRDHRRAASAASQTHRGQGFRKKEVESSPRPASPKAPAWSPMAFPAGAPSRPPAAATGR